VLVVLKMYGMEKGKGKKKKREWERKEEKETQLEGCDCYRFSFIVSRFSFIVYCLSFIVYRFECMQSVNILTKAVIGDVLLLLL
jgi:hypothetical protein